MGVKVNMEYKPTFKERFIGVLLCDIGVLIFSLLGSIQFYLISTGDILGDSYDPMMLGDVWFIFFCIMPSIMIIFMMFLICLTE